jgi:hypothetical protein
VNLEILLYIHGQLIRADGAELENTDHTAVTNNLLHSLFSQCSISLNGVTITPALDLYKYRAYLETLLNYGSDAAASHLTNSYWYLDNGDTLPGDLRYLYGRDKQGLHHAMEQNKTELRDRNGGTIT